jgi:hypothetical protein
LAQKAKAEGIQLSEAEAVDWIGQINKTFPDVTVAIQQIGNKARSSGKISSIIGTEFQLADLVQRTQNSSIWNATTRVSSCELVLMQEFSDSFSQIRECIALMWTKLKQHNLFERSGIVWIISDEVMFEIKGCSNLVSFYNFILANDVRQAKKLIKESIMAVNLKYKLSAALDVSVAIMQQRQKKPARDCRSEV